MKKIIAFLFAVMIMTGLSAQDKTKAQILQSFLNGVITFNAADINQHEPLISIRELAAEKAGKKISLTKDNIESALKEIGNYSNAIIIVGKHTIVKITDASDCQASGSWGACMPMGDGYVQKAGHLISHENYINFIIGIPDSQERTLYLFK